MKALGISMNKIMVENEIKPRVLDIVCTLRVDFEYGIGFGLSIRLTIGKYM